MKLYRSLRRALANKLKQREVQLVPGYATTLADLIRFRSRLLSPNTPIFVYGAWREALAPLLPAHWFAEADLDNVWQRFPGKLDRQAIVAQCLRNVCEQGIAGDVAEFGCFQGHTAIQIVRTMQAAGDGSPVLLFDSFAGMPPSDHPGDKHWNPGDLTADFEAVRRRFARYPQVQVVKGFFSETLPRFDSRVIKLGHVDADLYVSIKDVNDWLLPRIVPGGVIIYDDYGFSSCTGATQAVDEAMAGRRDFHKLYLPTGQYLAIKT